MYIIKQGNEVVENTPRIEYVKLQTNGKKVTSTADDFHFYYSPASDKMYDKEITYVYEVTTLETALSVQLENLSAACNAAINAGTTVTYADGTEESFTYTVGDQANIWEMFSGCILGVTSYPYHENDGGCKVYTAAQIATIYTTLMTYKTSQLTYHNQLKQYVKTLTSVEDVLNVTYGQLLTGEYLTRYNELMQVAQSEMAAVIENLMKTQSNGTTTGTDNENQTTTPTEPEVSEDVEDENETPAEDVTTTTTTTEEPVTNESADS